MACNCQKYPLPHMYIDAGTASGRRQRFGANQGLRLGTVLDPNKPALFYLKADFEAMYAWIGSSAHMGHAVDAVRIYLAVYSNVATPPVPIGYGGKFTYIFAPAKITALNPLQGNDIGRYFTVPPTGGFNPATCELAASIAQQWRNNWVLGPLAQLPVDQTNTNYDPATRQYSDTKCVIYRNAYLDELITEINCQYAAGVNIYLTSYLDNDNNFPKRLATQFTLADIHGTDMDLDVSCRKPHKFVNLDTGNPCPPATGCSS